MERKVIDEDYVPVAVLDWQAPSALLNNGEGLESARAALEQVREGSDAQASYYKSYYQDQGGHPHPPDQQQTNHFYDDARGRVLDWQCPEALLQNGHGLASARVALKSVAHALALNLGDDGDR